MEQRLGKFTVLLLLAGSLPLLGQTAKPAPNARPGLEFPASLQTKVVAGSTPAGSEVRARLTMATFQNGVVIPQDAVMTGHIVQSVARSKDSPSLLKIKFESARWKNGHAPLNLYLAGCYFPVEFPTSSSDTPGGIHGDIGINMGSAPPPNSLPRNNGGMSPSSMPSLDSNRLDNYPDPRPNSPLSEVSQHWIRMEKVDTVQAPDGSLHLTSSERNLKLDKGTVYLLRDVPEAPAK